MSGGAAMETPKSLATLSPKLLARKGGARPAMRSRVGDALARDLDDDLGWNDFGEDADHGTVVALHKARSPQPRSPRGSALKQGGRSAFTLRLDAERHLRLRLACTLDDRSAQALVTDALDRLLAEMPELEVLAEHVGKRRKS